jgi:hypothetical protein
MKKKEKGKQRSSSSTDHSETIGPASKADVSPNTQKDEDSEEPA